MTNFDFIPLNIVESNYTKENRIVFICKAFLSKRSWYDGRNIYAPKEYIVKSKIDGTITFSSIIKDSIYEYLFTPTEEEIKSALNEFKKRGYFIYYDNDVCEYGYVDDKTKIRGEYAIKHTKWL